MKRYTEAQIIKHALQFYIQRPGADPKDVHKEKTVLSNIEEEIERLRLRNRIPEREYNPLKRDYVLVSRKWSKSTLVFWGSYTKDNKERSFGGYTNDINACERYTLEEIINESNQFRPFDLKSFWKRSNSDETFYVTIDELEKHFKKPSTAFVL